jgi:hypothetical protein
MLIRIKESRDLRGNAHSKKNQTLVQKLKFGIVFLGFFCFWNFSNWHWVFLVFLVFGFWNMINLLWVFVFLGFWVLIVFIWVFWFLEYFCVFLGNFGLALAFFGFFYIQILKYWHWLWDFFCN